MKKYIWAFILAVAAADIYLTWACQASMLEWELNPVALFTFRHAGFAGAVAIRLLSLTSAGLVARLKSRCGWLVTPVCGLAHLYLLTVLAESYQYLPVLKG